MYPLLQAQERHTQERDPEPDLKVWSFLFVTQKEHHAQDNMPPCREKAAQAHGVSLAPHDALSMMFWHMPLLRSSGETEAMAFLDLNLHSEGFPAGRALAFITAFGLRGDPVRSSFPFRRWRA